MATLRESLNHTPQPLRFGTSGRRGEVIHLSQLEIYINARAELEYLQSRPATGGGLHKGDPFYFAADLRPSSTHFVAEQGGRGEIAQAIQRAIQDSGLTPVYLGQIPTPALTNHALRQGRGSIMVTGSHIPFDRNGYKTNSARGELLKQDESPIQERVEQVRAAIYNQPANESAFGPSGAFKGGSTRLPTPDPAAREAYLRRYTEFFAGHDLKGLRLLVYQHSAVGRDLLAQLLERLGAQVIAAGRSDTFVPIDTENINDDLLAGVQNLADTASNAHGPLDAVVSTDGDSDRPLILGVEPPSGKVRFFAGDLVGMVVAGYLGADAVVVPISCNDALDRSPLRDKLEPKTRIGSPFVIAGMDAALARGKRCVCGWEANGGFLTGSTIERGGHRLPALPTRDAFLPILGVLFAAREQGVSVTELFGRLPRRFSKAALLQHFPRPVSLRIVERFSPVFPRIKDVTFEEAGAMALDEAGHPIALSSEERAALCGIRTDLEKIFTAREGFGPIQRLNYVDGVRVTFRNGDVAHVRPSGNADELRVYAVADSHERAETIARLGVAEPDGLLRRLQAAVA
ncbi:MAG: phosphomannomutase [Verrucomicrobia bacterium]|jgi:phosphomannomutase|nr:phosphomannomutase [Verrucomicrobiota bacterium]